MVLYTPGSKSSYQDIPVENDSIRFHFLGGGEEVGNVGCILEDGTGTRILIDYGFVPSNPPSYPGESPPVEDLILTHSHIDHVGLAPWVASSHGAKIHCTELTGDILQMVWRDTYKVSSIEGQPLPWDKRDLDEAVDSIIKHSFGEWKKIGAWKWRFLPAGHIPGAAMVEIETPTRRILWSGDLDTRDSPCTIGAKPEGCDLLFLESTYAGRNQPNRTEEVSRFIERIVEVVERGGTCLIPAFANGRGQDILLHLWRSGLDFNVHFDGMGKTIMDHYISNPDYLIDSDELSQVKRWAKIVRGKSDRKKALGADVIVTTSGMLDGGPALWYLNRLRNDQRNAILLTGYQAEGSGGRNLLDEGRLPIFGKMTDIHLDVDQFSLSNHADDVLLREFAEGTGAKDVVLFHGQLDDGRKKFVKNLEERGITVHQPRNRESYEI